MTQRPRGIELPMSSLTIRNLDATLAARLRQRARRHGRSVPAEAGAILRGALNQEPAAPGNLAAAIRARFAPLGGAELPLPGRTPMRPAPGLSS